MGASSIAFFVADQVARPWTEVGGAVARVAEPAPVERQAAAADAGVELVAQALEEADALLQHRSPGGGKPLPVARAEAVVSGQGGQGLADLLESEPHPLGDLDERHPPEDGSAEPALPAVGPVRPDESPLLVEPQRGDVDPGAGGDRANGEIVVDRRREVPFSSRKV